MHSNDDAPAPADRLEAAAKRVCSPGSIYSQRSGITFAQESTEALRSAQQAITRDAATLPLYPSFGSLCTLKDDSRCPNHSAHVNGRARAACNRC